MEVESADQIRHGVSAWCIHHPIATTLLTAAAILLGVFAFPMLPLAALPEAEFPTIRISASLPGASPETMASAVATPLEVQLSEVPGVTEMTSTSSLGSTNITLQFDLATSTRPPRKYRQRSTARQAVCLRTCRTCLAGAKSIQPIARS
jgi:multidrug efflux pump subunit AcrB